MPVSQARIHHTHDEENDWSQSAQNSDTEFTEENSPIRSGLPLPIRLVFATNASNTLWPPAASVSELSVLCDP